jgi:hypothetical protein
MTFGPTLSTVVRALFFNSANLSYYSTASLIEKTLPACHRPNLLELRVDVGSSGW